MARLIKAPAFFFASILLISLIALALRLPKLAQRPMHGDEAVHAIKFGGLLEQGVYRYDSFEYHGPTLNYLTLLPAWISSAQKLSEVNEWTLRLVPVFFGTALVAMAALLGNAVGRGACINAALLAAISPAMAYYSRYYIQEMLLVCFTFGTIVCGYRYTLNRNLGWALATGVFLGLMHATKETCIIAWSAMLLAVGLTLAVPGPDRNAPSLRSVWQSLIWRHVAVAVALAGAVSVLFYSSFFTHVQGVWDSVATYKNYLSRAGHNPVHIQPWHYYLGILSYFRIGANPLWSEALILLLAGFGGVAAWRAKPTNEIDARLLRFLAFYTLAMMLIYSSIPYKTPWNLLSFLHGMILLAGVGAVAIARMLASRLARVAALALLVVGGLHLAWQAYLAVFEYDDDPANPYVYAHPVDDVFAITRRVEAIAAIHPEQSRMHVQVICPDDDYWPLPWYLRAYPNVGWWNKVDERLPAAPLFIASPQVEPALMHRLYESPPPGQRPLYVPLFDSYTELRPRVELRGYVRKDLWDSLQESVLSNQ